VNLITKKSSALISYLPLRLLTLSDPQGGTIVRIESRKTRVS
jgi:hypothetical protein